MSFQDSNLQQTPPGKRTMNSTYVAEKPIRKMRRRSKYATYKKNFCWPTLISLRNCNFFSDAAAIIKVTVNECVTEFVFKKIWLQGLRRVYKLTGSKFFHNPWLLFFQFIWALYYQSFSQFGKKGWIHKLFYKGFFCYGQTLWNCLNGALQ